MYAITRAGQPCRRCGTPVEKKTHQTRPPSGRRYYFRWWFRCAVCKDTYMAQAAKVSTPDEAWIHPEQERLPLPEEPLPFKTVTARR